MRTRRLVIATAFQGGLVIFLASSLVVCGGTNTPTAPTSSAAASVSINFVSSSPAPNTIVVTGAGPNDTPPDYLPTSALSMTFSARSDKQIAGVKLKVELLDASGVQCGFSYSDPQDLLTDVPTSFTVGHFLWRCPVPTYTPLVEVTVSTPTGPVQRFIQIAYMYQRYPVPPDVPPSPPVITALGWRSTVMGCGDCAAPGDPLSLYCGAYEADGASVTTTLVITWDGHAPQSITTTFPPGASSAPSRYVGYWSGPVTGAASVLSTGVPLDAGPLPHATAVCSTVNLRGDTATKTINVPF
jgi:hypothetical protein